MEDNQGKDAGLSPELIAEEVTHIAKLGDNVRVILDEIFDELDKLKPTQIGGKASEDIASGILRLVNKYKDFPTGDSVEVHVAEYRLPDGSTRREYAVHHHTNAPQEDHVTRYSGNHFYTERNPGDAEALQHYKVHLAEMDMKGNEDLGFVFDKEYSLSSDGAVVVEDVLKGGKDIPVSDRRELTRLGGMMQIFRDKLRQYKSVDSEEDDR